MNFKYESYHSKLLKNFAPKYSSCGYIPDKLMKNNILNLDCYVKNYDHKLIIENLGNSIEEKIRARYVNPVYFFIKINFLLI